MGINGVNSEARRRAIGYLTDPRPAWLWTANGDELLWRNPAAKLFRAKSKRHGLKLAPLAVPIKGQVSRIIRLGATGRASLSRIQFLAGSKPVSATCTCTPLPLDEGRVALLVVAVDRIDKELMAEHGLSAEILDDVFDTNTGFVINDAKGNVLAASASAAHFDSARDEAISLSAGPNAAKVVLFAADQLDASDENPVSETAPEPDTDTVPARDLGSLLDRLADDEALFTPLGPEDDVIPEGISSPVTFSPAPDGAAPVQEQAEDAASDAVEDDDTIVDETISTPDADLPDDQSDIDPPVEATLPEVAESLWRIVGRGFEPETVADDTPEPESAPAPAAEDVSSRYNFEELSRILSDRVGRERQASEAGTPDVVQLPPSKAPSQQNSLVNLSDESLVLNRLPLGLLIFRDQQILFANRALTELVGYPDSASLRAVGMGAIFPSPSQTGENAGPVNHLAHRDGSQVPVAARLQSVTWQGGPAFMLTARHELPPVGPEMAVRSFAESLAAVDGSGFLETSRAGIISSVSGQAAALLGRTPEVLIGRPLVLMAGHKEAANLREFLEKPARFAGTARPSLIMRGIDPTLEIILFAEGQAGIVTGYFGLVRRAAAVSDSPDRAFAPAPVEPAHENGIDPSILSRLSRGVRRPLNTIIGFAELIRSHAFGQIENERYTEYARDIKFAGQEIVGVIDELEDFVRLHTGEYQAAPVDFDLGLLLDKCMVRVRGAAGAARVLVRSAISERLPHIRADEASLEQAILNLLASAIDQTPQGGQVVLSAQREEDGAVAIHVRDSGSSTNDLSERFVVFRDGLDPSGAVRRPVHSSVGLALTRSLLAVNTCTLTIDPAVGAGTLLSLVIPADMAVDRD